jgi:hypothetical protein
MPELPVVVHQTPKKDEENSDTKLGSTPKSFPDSVPSQGTIKNPFGHLSSQSEIHNSSANNMQITAHNENGKTSQSPKSSEGSLILAEAAKAVTTSPFEGIFGPNFPQTTNKKLTGILRGLKSDTSLKAATNYPSSGETASTKSINGMFSFGAATTTPLGGGNVSKPSFKRVESATSGLFGSSSFGTTSINTSSTLLGDTSLKVAGDSKSGLSSGRSSPAPAETSNSLK